mgnify:FL=1
MVETAYVLIKTDETAKEMVVESRSFAYGSDEAKIVKEKQIELQNIANRQGYKIICNGETIIDYAKQKADYEAKKQKEQKEHLDRVKKLSNIMSKDLTELNEEEIVLLALSRVHGTHYVTKDGQLALGKETTFEEEKEKLLDAIEKKKKEKKERLFEIKTKDLTELTKEEIVLLAQSRVNETQTIYDGKEGAYQKVMDIMSEYQKIKDVIEQKMTDNISFDEQPHKPYM